MAMTEADWGAQREAARRRLRWMAGGVMAVAAGFFIWLVPDDASPASDTTRLLSAAAFLAFVLLGAFMARRWSDEIERRRLISTLAVIGFASFLLTPLAGMLAPVVPIANPVLVAWTVSLAAGLAMRIGQRVRA
ncbi:hypothetical protein EAH79_13050 [Sphingomonas koreensis]|nr:hypothetical protein EAH79_13050 [Sphingomonas koreensis]